MVQVLNAVQEDPYSQVTTSDRLKNVPQHTQDCIFPLVVNVIQSASLMRLPIHLVVCDQDSWKKIYI